MPDVLGSVRRAERRAAALPTGYRLNLALYALVLLGVGLIALEVRGSKPATREVQTRPRVATETTSPPSPAVDSEPPTVLGPGDLTPTPPPPVTPGGVVVGEPAPSAPAAPSEPSTASGPSGGSGRAPDTVETVAQAAPDPTPVFTGVVPSGGGTVTPTPVVAVNRPVLPADDPAPAPVTEVTPPNAVRVSPVSIPPVRVPPPVQVAVPVPRR